MARKIKLGDKVVVSDPCYTIPTWCQIIVENVIPGYYVPMVRGVETDGWGNRTSMQMCIHEDYIGKESELLLSWVEHGGTVGVDSGQAGIFSRESYRNDKHPIEKGGYDFELTLRDGDGDEWYEKMCQRTLDVSHWGLYDEGVVSSSGFGDGSYPLYVLITEDDKVVGFCIDFEIEEDETIDFEFYKDGLNY